MQVNLTYRQTRLMLLALGFGLRNGMQPGDDLKKDLLPMAVWSGMDYHYDVSRADDVYQADVSDDSVTIWVNFLALFRSALNDAEWLTKLNAGEGAMDVVPSEVDDLGESLCELLGVGD